MDRRTFEERAARMWEQIPGVFREGVEALVVEADALLHPDIPGIYTLGECVTDHWPSAYSEEGGEVRSRIVLHHGSFREVARQDPAFDWEGEIWETLLHELLHHREFAASEYGLEAYDWAMDENFKRHAGRPFDPAFYRAVPADADGTVRIESETFVETELPPGGREASFRWRDRDWTVTVPPSEAVLFVNPDNLAADRLWVVVWRRRPWWRRLLRGSWTPDGVEHLYRRAAPARAA